MIETLTSNTAVETLRTKADWIDVEVDGEVVRVWNSIVTSRFSHREHEDRIAVGVKGHPNLGPVNYVTESSHFDPDDTNATLVDEQQHITAVNIGAEEITIVDADRTPEDKRRTRVDQFGR